MICCFKKTNDPANLRVYVVNSYHAKRSIGVEKLRTEVCNLSISLDLCGVNRQPLTLKHGHHQRSWDPLGSHGHGQVGWWPLWCERRLGWWAKAAEVSMVRGHNHTCGYIYICIYIYIYIYTYKYIYIVTFLVPISDNIISNSVAQSCTTLS